MNFQIFKLLVLSALLVVAGCDKKVMTVADYIANPTELLEQKKKCDDNPGELKQTPSCINSHQARMNIKIEWQGLASKKASACSEYASDKDKVECPARTEAFDAFQKKYLGII